uniref:aminotransferase class I/II-fold pyridoxal phosphate-dependent enzyme n=1 Tax=Coleofasciculus sp. FACHB-SPT9 TaxID=2692791 RepID=UPI0030D9013B
MDIINSGAGDPDRPTPAHIVQAMHEAINELSTHNYPPDRRTKEYRKAAADWMERRLGVAGLNIEFQSLSKSYKMTAGWVGFVVGNPTEIKGLGQVKTNVDSGIFKAIQRAAIAAYETSEEERQAVMSVYQNRRNIIVEGLQSLGWPIEPPKAILYI